MREYNLPWPFSKLAPLLMTKMRIWDRASADRVDKFIANSYFVAKRIKKYYQKDSEVIYPFVDLDRFKIKSRVVKNSYFLALGRLIPYKKFDLLIEAFNFNGLALKIIGTGKDAKKLKKMAKNNIEFLGRVSDKQLEQYYQQAQALIFPQVEDFGIVPLEAMACGTPIIAYQEGGALETINARSGVFFDNQSSESLNQTINEFLTRSFDPKIVRKQAEKFAKVNFEKQILKKIGLN